MKPWTPQFLLRRAPEFQDDEYVVMKSGDEYVEVHPTIAKALQTPAPAEEQFLERLRKAGVPQSQMGKARGILRLTQTLDDDKRERLLASLRPIPVAKTEPKPEPEPSALDGLERFAIEKQRSSDMLAGWRLEQEVARVRRREPLLSKEAAFAKAARENPDLVEGDHRERLRKQGFLVDSPVTLEQQRAAEQRIEKAADDLRAADPGLTREQALSRAYRENPNLTDQTRGAQ